MAKSSKKKLKPAIWSGYTEHEMRAVKLLGKMFGRLTVTEPYEWQRVPFRAKYQKCPDCGTWFQAREWWMCTWCGRANELR